MRRVVGKAAAHPRGTPRRGRRSRSGGRGTGSAAGGLLEVGRDVLRALLLELGLDLVAGADAMVLELVERHLVLDGEVDALAALRVLERGDRGVAVRREVDLRDDAEQLLLGAGDRAGGEGEGDGEGQRGSELLHVRSPVERGFGGRVDQAAAEREDGDASGEVVAEPLGARARRRSSRSAPTNAPTASTATRTAITAGGRCSHFESVNTPSLPEFWNPPRRGSSSA